MRFGTVASVRILEDGFDDLCRLYLDVLNDLWEVDPSLNDGITELGVDLSGISLPESEQAAVAYAFGSAHGLMAMEGTYQDFVDSGYIDGEALFWKDGCLFSVKETQDENPVTFNLPSFGPGDEMPDYSGVRFDAEKWRQRPGGLFLHRLHRCPKWRRPVGRLHRGGGGDRLKTGKTPVPSCKTI